MEIRWWCQTGVKNWVISDELWVMSDEWWVMEIEWSKKWSQTAPYSLIDNSLFFFLVKNIDNWNCRIWKNMMTQFDRTRWHRLCAWEKVARTLFFKMMRQPTRYYYAKVLIVRDKLSQILNTVKLICQDITWENLCAQILP